MINHYQRFIFLLCIVFLNSCASDSENKEEPDIVAPVIAFSIGGFPNTTTTPIVVSNKIEISVDAQDEGGISKIEAFINGDKMGEDLTAPYTISIDISTFTSKIAGSNKYKDYILKVTATDKTGNTSSKEQAIYIDNELPSISEVSLLENQIINGYSNEVTFLVTDNQEISSITVFLNDTSLSIIEGDTLKVNIPTLNLTDGINLLKIEATDSAENTAIYTVNFISDNTGPEISVENLIEGMIIDESFLFTPNITDIYSEIDSVQISINDSIVLHDLFTNGINYTLDPESFPIGENLININASDQVGNKTILDITQLIHRRLLKITFENETINPGYAKFYVFASDSNGELLDIKEASISTTELILNTTTDINSTTEFMVTFAGFLSGYGDFSILSTIQNITRDNLKIINLKTPKKEYVVSNLEFHVVNNPTDYGIDGYGSFYSASYFPDSDALHFETREVANSNINHSDKVYLKSYNYNNYTYSYMLLDFPLAEDMVIDYSQFISDGVENRFYNAPFTTGDNGKSTSLNLFGYLNETDFNNDSSHLLWNEGRGLESNFDSSNGILYSLDTQFSFYRYELQLEDYFTKRIGAPLDYYSYPDWSIDFNQNGNTIEIISTGLEHTNGNIFLENSEGVDKIYRWNLLFNSQTTSNIILPKLPNELSSWNINDVYNSNTIEIQQVELKRYEGINSYEEYLQNSIKPNLNSRKTSDFIESIFNNPRYNIHRDTEDLFVIF
tara:strand:- start:863 stop:3064 length:2202 start_codon:yes stop_codon:yes gene_type:complete